MVVVRRFASGIGVTPVLTPGAERAYRVNVFGSRRENGNCAGCRNLADTLEATRRKVEGIEYDLAQLTDRFRRWQGRVSKQASLDLEAVDTSPPGMRPAGDPPDGSGASEAMRVVAMRRSRTFPGGGR
jgi:hypothetical protein